MKKERFEKLVKKLLKGFEKKREVKSLLDTDHIIGKIYTDPKDKCPYYIRPNGGYMKDYGNGFD